MQYLKKNIFALVHVPHGIAQPPGPLLLTMPAMFPRKNKPGPYINVGYKKYIRAYFQGKSYLFMYNNLHFFTGIKQ